MLEYQYNNTPGYLISILKTIRNISFDQLNLLYSNICNDINISVSIITGNKNILIPSLTNINQLNNLINNYKNEINLNLLESNNELIKTKNFVHIIENCGHHVIFEKFNETMEILILFLRNELIHSNI